MLHFPDVRTTRVSRRAFARRRRSYGAEARSGFTQAGRSRRFYQPRRYCRRSSIYYCRVGVSPEYSYHFLCFFTSALNCWVISLSHDKNIPFIHSSCDRWRERCPFTSRCGVYVMEESLLEEQKDIVNPAFFSRIMLNRSRRNFPRRDEFIRPGFDEAKAQLD